MIFWDKDGRTMAKQVIDNSAKKAQYETEATEILRTQKMYDYLKNDSAAIRYHLREYLLKIMNAQTLNNLQLVWLNEVPRIIKRLCLVYKSPAKRVLDNEAAQKKYDEVTKSLHKASKEIHEQGKLFNTILVRPIYNANRKQLDYLIIARNIGDVDMEENDSLAMKELRYQIDYCTDDDKQVYETAVIHWTDEENWATDINNEKDITNKLSWMPEDKKNPYGRIPFEVLRFEDCADFWGDGMPDLVEGQEALNGRLTDMFYKLYMSFGQPMGINLNIKKTEFAIGYDKPILNDNVKPGDLPPSLTFATPEHKVELDQVTNDWFKDQLANTKGLPSNGIRYASGYDREVDNLELLDLNENDQEILRDFEERRFELEKIVLKVDAKIDLGGVKCQVEFAKIEFPITETELIARRNFELLNLLSTPIDWLMEKKPGLTREGALKIILANKKEIEDITPKAQSKLTDIMTANLAGVASTDNTNQTMMQQKEQPK